MTINYDSPREERGSVPLRYWLELVKTANPGDVLATGNYFTVLSVKKRLALRGIKTSVERDGASEILKPRGAARFRLTFLGEA